MFKRIIEIITKAIALLTIGARAVDEPKSAAREYHASVKGVYCDSNDYIEDWSSIGSQAINYIKYGTYHPSVSVITSEYIKANKASL